ncbi:lamin tail domain-containing protein [Halalkalicoccus subterraneus]|uniref:lamin tail domain-containing protein n=1 Tax=Halalkalicoccus subterraneus TaxID=2675002 RepID=UPI000EFBB9D5|nr:lamin tail domain-containing protein [Halalkalicoccus subterraneus]
MPQQKTNTADESGIGRRTVLKTGIAVSAAVMGISATSPGIAQSELSLSLDVDAEAETVTIVNNGDSAVDLTGYQMNFEAGGDSEVDQTRTLAGEVIIEAGDSVTVATGAGDEGDVSLEDPYEGEVLNNENPDVVALLSPEGNVVASTDETGSPDESGDEEDSSGDDEGPTEENGDENESESDDLEGESDSEIEDEDQDNDGDDGTGDSDASSNEDCPEEEPEPEDDCPEEKPEPEPEDDCPDE